MILIYKENRLLCSCKIVLKKRVFKLLSLKIFLQLNSNSTFKGFMVNAIELSLVLKPFFLAAYGLFL